MQNAISCNSHKRRYDEHYQLFNVHFIIFVYICFIDQTDCNCKENDTKHNIQNSRSSIKSILQPLSSCNRIPKNQSFCDKIIQSVCHCNRKPTDRKKCHCKKYFLIDVSSVLYIHHKKCSHNSQHICRKIANLLRYQIQHRHNSNINNTDQSSFPFLFHIWIYKNTKTDSCNNQNCNNRKLRCDHPTSFL